MTNPTATVFESLVRSRHAVRQFLPQALSEAELQAVLQDAQQAPSNCNTQPWQVHIVSGAARDALAAALTSAVEQGAFAPDFFFDQSAFEGALAQRCRDSGKAHYELLQIGREDAQARNAEGMRNFSFFGAPHVALLFMPAVGDSVRVAGDLGMYGQTFLLSLAAHGLAGIPQTSVSMFAPTIRRALGIGDQYKLLFAISFGHADPDATVNRLKVGRADLSESVVMHG
ncbi:nitroreductase [Comamonas testosteroni]|uniref:Nitroreductase n=1 Tax=Comamonas testosteroni TaxID=285 RepID=A0A373FU54_COMTE|nr:nitroreductase [Comamonas testosteroni]RGE46929.1 nitroreductase [Comamonas testosteroni]